MTNLSADEGLQCRKGSSWGVYIYIYKGMRFGGSMRGLAVGLKRKLLFGGSLQHRTVVLLKAGRSVSEGWKGHLEPGTL